jgi:type VI secretion system protein ImpD
VATSESSVDARLRAAVRTADGEAALRELLCEDRPAFQLAALVRFVAPGETVDRRTLLRRTAHTIAAIDRMLDAQVNAVLHHPRFQALEASWRGLAYLAEQAEGMDNVKIRMLDVSWRTLVKDLEKAIEFDQSQLFQKVYGEEFGTPGGEPFGVLLGDYQVRHRPGPGHPTHDIAALGEIAQVAAAAFCPFVTGVDPSLFGLERFEGLRLPIDLEKTFSQTEYVPWHAFREKDDARFVGLCVPRVLMRRPYADDGSRHDGFRFHEAVAGPDASRYLWGNPCYAFGVVLMRAFSAFGWFADIRGSRWEDGEGGGVVDMPAADAFATDRGDAALKFGTEVLVTDVLEKDLGDHGFIPLCHSRDTRKAVFYSNASAHRSAAYRDEAVTANAALSAMLQYMLCCSRFAHYVKVIGREKMGSFATAEECEQHLAEWLLGYAMDATGASEELRARYPLSDVKVEVKDVPGRPGVYMCVAHLKPHVQLDHMVSAVRLVTELAGARG